MKHKHAVWAMRGLFWIAWVATAVAIGSLTFALFDPADLQSLWLVALAMVVYLSSYMTGMFQQMVDQVKNMKP